MAEFNGLSPDAFAAYAPEKWSSNVHNLARMKVKDTLVQLCDYALADIDGELTGLDRATSDEVPTIVNHKKVDAQWVYWFRNAAARDSLASFLKKTPLNETTIFNIAPQDKHATLAVVLRQSELWVGLRLASGALVDRRNLAAKLAKSWEREALLDLVAELPEGARVGLTDGLQVSHDVTLEALQAQAERLSSNDPDWLVGHAVAADEAVELGVDLADHVGRWLGTLAPLYSFCAWSPQNDHIDAGKQIKEEKEQQRRQASGYNPGDKVRIVAGLFSGKLGVVETIDAKAQVKVRVGKMSVVLSGRELIPAR